MVNVMSDIRHQKQRSDPISQWDTERVIHIRVPNYRKPETDRNKFYETKWIWSIIGVRVTYKVIYFMSDARTCVNGASQRAAKR